MSSQGPPASVITPGYAFDTRTLRDASDWVKLKKQARIFWDDKILTPKNTSFVYGNDFRLESLSGRKVCFSCQANAFIGPIVLPCFLAGSLVHMADGTTKCIEDVQVNDLVIGAFGEINTVLALHRPILGTAKMCKINNEHNTTNHHPHVSIDKKFYCGDPGLVSSSTYGHKHKVIDANGNIVERMLDGLKKERIQKLELGVELKTIEGSRLINSLEVYSMPQDTQLYNLVISGSHTYHVDGYAVTGWPSEKDFDYDNWC